MESLLFRTIGNMGTECQYLKQAYRSLMQITNDFLMKIVFQLSNNLLRLICITFFEVNK